LLAFSTARLWPGNTDLSVFEAAGGVAAVLLAVAAWLSWRRPPLWLALVVPVGCDLRVGLLRQAQSGSNSGYSPLVLVPVVWTGLVLGRRAVLVISGCTTLLFVVPIVAVGPPLYPHTSVSPVRSESPESAPAMGRRRQRCSSAVPRLRGTRTRRRRGFRRRPHPRRSGVGPPARRCRARRRDRTGTCDRVLRLDRQGHSAGDRLLRNVSACWWSALRDSDILGRIGGDEFAVILEQADGETARRVARRLAESLRSGEVTVATGLATWNPPGGRGGTSFPRRRGDVRAQGRGRSNGERRAELVVRTRR
jgi:hypothetical protein